MTDEIKQDLYHLEGRVRDQELWSSAHDGRITVLWENQDDFNKAFRASMDNLIQRTEFLERRFTWVIGFVAAVGTIGGNLFALSIALYLNS